MIGTRTTRRGMGIATGTAGLLVAALTVLPDGAAMAGGAPPAGEGDRAGAPVLHCDGGVCLRYAQILLADSDGDGFTDADERAAGTDPYDPTSRPPVLDLVGLVGAGRLPSFTAGYSQVVVLPDRAPDGSPVGRELDLKTLDAALGGLAPTRASGLERLGISSELLGKFGVGGSDLLGIVAGAATSKDEPAFEVRVGGIAMSQLAAGISGVRVTNTPTEDGGKVTQVSWFETDGGTTTSYQVSIEYEDGAQTGSGVVKVTQGKDGTTTESCHSELGQLLECGGELGDAIEKGRKLKNEQAKKDAAQPSPAPASQEPAPQPSASASASAEPTPASSSSASPAPSASGGSGDGGTYVNPDADTRIIVTTADVRRVIRLVQGSDTTPAQVDRDTPELDPSTLGNPLEPYEYRDGPRETVTLATISPVKLGDAITNYGDPLGPVGPRPLPSGALQ